MINRMHIRAAMAAVALALGSAAMAQPEILATVGKYSVSAAELEQAIASSPFSSRFVAMDRDQQAALRGDLLKRLVASRLLTLEAERLGLDRNAAFRQELEIFRRGELYQAYWDKLRAGLTLSAEEDAALRATLAGDADALATARSDRLAKRYRRAKLERLRELKQRYQVKDYPERLLETPEPNALLAEGRGFAVTYREVTEAAGKGASIASQEEALYDRLELLLAVQAATDAGMEVSDRVAQFKRERLPAILLERKAREWIPDREAARAYFERHPDLGYVPEVRHVGQLVVADEALAKRLYQRISAGESLFELAREHSIDPYGKQHAGDMGWLKEGSGMPAIEAALATLPDNAVSEPVHTTRGWHLLTVLGRRKARQLRFEQVEDRVQQAMYNDNVGPYLQRLGDRYKVAWSVLQPEG